MIYDSSLLGCDAVSVRMWFPKFPKKVSPSPSRAQTFITSEILLGVLYEVKQKGLMRGGRPTVRVSVRLSGSLPFT